MRHLCAIYVIKLSFIKAIFELYGHAGKLNYWIKSTFLKGLGVKGMKSMLRIIIAGLALMSFAGIAAAEGDAVKGKKVFKRCAACHKVGEGAKHKIGPELNNLFGRTAGTAEGFKYSKAMVDAGAGGKVWNAETLAAFLAKPRKDIPKNKMSFSGLRKPKQIANVIAFLQSHSKAEAAAAAAPAAAAPAAAEPTAPAAAAATAPAAPAAPAAP